MTAASAPLDREEGVRRQNRSISGSSLERHLPYLVVVIGILAPSLSFGQEPPPPILRAGSGAETITIDGALSEPAWAGAELVDSFAQTEPSEGMAPTFRTTVQVLASRNVIVLGVVCEDDPNGIVGF